MPVRKKSTDAPKDGSVDSSLDVVDKPSVAAASKEEPEPTKVRMRLSMHTAKGADGKPERGHRVPINQIGRYRLEHTGVEVSVPEAIAAQLDTHYPGYYQRVVGKPTAKEGEGGT